MSGARPGVVPDGRYRCIMCGALTSEKEAFRAIDRWAAPSLRHPAARLEKRYRQYDDTFVGRIVFDSAAWTGRAA